MNKWQEKFQHEDIFFVTPDVKRGLGFAGILPKYHIVCTDFDPVIPVVRKQGAKIFCLEEIGDLNKSRIRNSGKLLETPQVLEYININSKGTPKLIYFKPSVKLDNLSSGNHFLPIGNNFAVNEIYEDKIHFYHLAQQYFPEHSQPSIIGIIAKLNYTEIAGKFSTPFVLQFGHGWAGKTTFFIHGEEEFNILLEKFPHTNVKISKFVEGFTILNNCCIYNGKILISSPAVQIDSIEQLCNKKGVTCGRQWPSKFISKDQIELIYKISQMIGNLMNKDGYRGFFGIDFLVEKSTGKVFASEVNARLTASAAFFTLLEIGLDTIPLMAYHLAEFIGVRLPERVNNDEVIGSQIILRKPYDKSISDNNLFGVYNYKEKKPVLVRNDYRPQGLNHYEYIFMGRNSESLKSGDEYARIESKCEVLERPGKFNSQFTDIIRSF